VTSAFHIPRAIGAFRAAGFTVEAYPVEYLSASPSGEARVAAKEIMGLAYYRLTGHSEPPRVCRRPFCLSHAAMAGSSSCA
jgi:hypothetical protein